MKVSGEEKTRSRARIIRSAAERFRRDGIEGAAVADIMTAAGLTHGGFYRHFPSKEALFDASVGFAFDELIAGLEAEPALGHFERRYLSEEHIADAGHGCPVAALAGDVARQTEPMKRSFGAGVRRMIAAMSAPTRGSRRLGARRATRQLAMMAGAVMIARASDPDTARDVLAACRAAVAPTQLAGAVRRC